MTRIMQCLLESPVCDKSDAPANGRLLDRSSLSPTTAATGYCSCTHLNCRVAQMPACHHHVILVRCDGQIDGLIAKRRHAV